MLNSTLTGLRSNLAQRPSSLMSHSVQQARSHGPRGPVLSPHRRLDIRSFAAHQQQQSLCRSARSRSKQPYGLQLLKLLACTISTCRTTPRCRIATFTTGACEAAATNTLQQLDHRIDVCFSVHRSTAQQLFQLVASRLKVCSSLLTALTRPRALAPSSSSTAHCLAASAQAQLMHNVSRQNMQTS